MCTIARCVGPLSATEFVAKLAAAMAAHDDKLAQVRLQRQEQAAQRNLRAEQESAYERSLAQDREKTRRRKEEEEKKAREEKEALAAAEREELDRQNLVKWKRWRAARLKSEPDAKDAAAIRISIRLQSGERVIRRFRADAELEELYAFVECYDLLKEQEGGSIADEKLEPPSSDFKHRYPFRLVSPMPRNVYELNDEGGGGIAGERVGKGANLIVESIEDEGEEE